MPRNGLSTASEFELVPPLPEPTTDGAVMRAYRVNPLSIFPARAYEEDRVVRPFFGRPSVLTSRAEDIRHVLLDNADNYRRSRAGSGCGSKTRRNRSHRRWPLIADRRIRAYKGAPIA